MHHKEYLHYQKADLAEIETTYDKALDEMLNKINNQEVDAKTKNELINAFAVGKETGRYGFFLSLIKKLNLKQTITISEIYKLAYLHDFINEKTKGDKK